MRLLLDTHALLWWLLDDEQLDQRARVEIANPRNQVFVSAVNAWEIAIKVGLGKLRVPDDPATWLPPAIAASRFEELVIDVRHALGIGALPPHHTDPFDRLLIAQAALEGLTVVTRDAQFASYDVPLLCC